MPRRPNGRRGISPSATDSAVLDVGCWVETQHPTPNTQHPTPNTQHPTPMKVTRIETALRLREPSPDPIRDALQALPGSGTVEVLLHTDDGLTGRGDAGFGRIAGGPRAVQVIVEEVLAPLVVGRDPACVRQIHEDLLRETEYCGSQGLAMFGIAAVDTALWDLLGKAAG